MLNTLLVAIGKLVRSISYFLRLGHGSTWPGHIALESNKHFLKEILAKNRHLKIILIAGTNGKTTTGKMIQTILEHEGKSVFQNQAGANLLNGIASSLVEHSAINGYLNYDYAIFEVDENTLPLALEQITPSYIILLNLFRDQLDRYGEVDSIANKWNKALQHLKNKQSFYSNKTILILNADDPQIAYLGHNHKNQIFYFGLNDKKLAQTSHQHAADSAYCPNCGTKLNYKTVYFSHLGDWICSSCQLTRPRLSLTRPRLAKLECPLKGTYNQYNANSVLLFAKLNNINNRTIEQSLRQFKPAFGRQEIIKIEGKKVQLFLSKNPTSMNESLRTVQELGAKYILFVLNDRIPDGRDVSWIWDVDFEEFLTKDMHVRVSGDRAFDIAVRLKYAHPAINHVDTHTLLEKALPDIIRKIPKDETLYILPTYSAMLEVRKILTGRKIL